MQFFEVRLDGGDAHEVRLLRSREASAIWIDGSAYAFRSDRIGDCAEVTINERTERMWVVVQHDAVFVHAFGRAFRLEVVDPVERAMLKAQAEDSVLAPMPGTVLEVFVAPGQEIVEGESLMIMESMKMQTEIMASRDGEVESVNVEVGDSFDRGAVLISLASLESEEA